MSQLPKNLFEDNVIRPRSLFSKVYGLNFITKNRSSLFDKKFGVPRSFDWSTPRIRRFERPAHSRRKHISIIQKFNDCLLLAKMRLIVESSYFFGLSLSEKVNFFLEKKKRSQTYRYIRTFIGLPCSGQRTKTNARTCKRQRSLSDETDKILISLSTHQSENLIAIAKELSSKRAAMIKFRMLKDLMLQKRYRPKSSNVDIMSHYEQVYQHVIAAKKRRKNPNFKK